MATWPEIAHEFCPTCGKPRMIWNRDRDPAHAYYQCGTTTMMLREGWHNDGRTYAEVNRTTALWKQHLRATGRTHLDDPMLPGYRPTKPTPQADENEWRKNPPAEEPIVTVAPASKKKGRSRRGSTSSGGR